MDIVHTPTMFLVFVVMNVLDLGINSCTGLTGQSRKSLQNVKYLTVKGFIFQICL